MISKLFKKHCFTCGGRIEKEKIIKKHNKHFCSEDHAEQYSKEVKEKNVEKHKGGCCG